jgi:osmotically-inducible protein OsmY
VEAELDWDARIDSRQLAVAVKNGVVTLSGHVRSYVERRAAEEAAQSIAGVRAVANDIVIELLATYQRSDSEIGDAAANALQANVAIPAEHIKIVVSNGWVTLDGELPMWYQRNAAETAIATLAGVKGISNNIVITARPSVSDVQSKILEAFRRRALLDTKDIKVTTNEGTVTLEGEVHSWQERQQAEAAAWQAPGVSQVLDNLHVRPRPV